MKTAIFAGGCFWCVEHDLRAISGVVNAVSGYSGGTKTDPTYSDHGDHREAVEVSYDPNLVTYKKLCQFFLDHIDPTDSNGQFYDRGESYKTAIYYKNDDEKTIAEGLIQELQESGLYPNESILVQVLPATAFYPAESYHQEYAKKIRNNTRLTPKVPDESSSFPRHATRANKRKSIGKINFNFALTHNL